MMRRVEQTHRDKVLQHKREIQPAVYFLEVRLFNRLDTWMKWIGITKKQTLVRFDEAMRNMSVLHFWLSDLYFVHFYVSCY